VASFDIVASDERGFGFRGAGRRAAAGVGAALLACASCVGPPPAPRASAPAGTPERTLRQLRQRDPESGTVVREWSAWLAPGRRAAKHGLEIGRWPSGAPRFERRWEYGEPRGEWLAWYESGALLSRIVFAGPDTPVEAVFWHGSGAVAARGPARDGVREGAWSYFHPDGTPAAEGEYARSLRVGQWSFWDQDGALAARGRYERNRRVGSWYVRPGGEVPDALELELALDTRAEPDVPRQ
jgi:hypothetical protein